MEGGSLSPPIDKTLLFSLRPRRSVGMGLSFEPWSWESGCGWRWSMLAISSVGDLRLPGVGKSSFRFRGGVIDGGSFEFEFPLKMLVTRLLLVSCCFFCRIVSANESTFRILAARFSSE